MTPIHAPRIVVSNWVHDEVLTRLQGVGHVGANHGVIQPKLNGPRPSPLLVDVDQPDDREAIDLSCGVQPGMAHGPATNEHGSQHAISSRDARV